MAGPEPLISVLVVDDDEDVRDSTRLLLDTFGVSARTARHGEEAWALIVADAPDLVLCDLQMPGLDGFGLVRRLRAEQRLCGVVVIAVSGRGAPADLAAAREAGFDGHFVKPITEEILHRLLEHVRERRGRAGP